MRYFSKITALLLTLLLFLGNSVSIFAETTTEWHDKIDAQIYEKSELSPDKKIPVCIWLSDINHKKVIKNTENTLGYGIDDLTVINEKTTNISISDIYNANSLQDSNELKSFIKQTEKQRAAEKIKTDNYISEKRKNFRAEYKEHNDDFIQMNKIQGNEILFESLYAPMVVADLTIEKIEMFAKQSNVENIYYYEEIVCAEPSNTMGEICDSTRISYIHDTLGLTGQNVILGIVESYNVDTSSELPADRFLVAGPELHSNETSPHVNNTAKILAGTNGIANEATVYSGSVEVSNYFSVIENLISAGAVAINSSFGYVYHYYPDNNEDLSTYMSNNNYTFIDKWVDHVAASHNVSMVVSSGNNGHNRDDNNNVVVHRILAPGLAYNTITVGAYDNKNTVDISDDIMYNYSSCNNMGGCEKPDLVAPANMLGGGTSSSAPFVTGLIALMVELRPSLAIYPQVIKSILLASCHHKAKPADANSSAETMSQGLTNKQGAGVINPYEAISITANGNYGFRILNSANNNLNINLTQPSYDATGLNVSIAWLKNNTAVGTTHSSIGNIVDANIHNVDLKLKHNSSTLKTSSKTNSSTEMVYYSSPSTYSDYIISINDNSASTENISCGYAWSVNTGRFQHTDEFEGVFYIKNKGNGYYLNMNSNNSTVAQTSFSNSLSQQWIVSSNGSGYYKLNSAHNNSDCLSLGTLIENNYYKISTDTTNTAKDFILINDDGSFSVYKLNAGKKYILTAKNTSTPAWQNITSGAIISDNQKWFMEKLCYQKADVNLDGLITAADSRLIARYSAQLESPTKNIETFLADVNGDKKITAVDSRLALRYSSNLE